MKKLLIIILIFTIHLFAKNVLILNSYSPILKWTAIQTHTLIDELQTVPNTKVYIEYMDTKNFRPTKEREKNYLNFFENKYKHLSFDVIVVTDDNALNFVRKYKNENIFKKAKVFFEGINNLKLANILDKNTYAGVFEAKNPLSNLEIAKKINPHLKLVYVISDASITGNKTIKQYRDAFRNIEGITFIYINEANINKIIKKIEKTNNKDSIMMLLTFGSMYHNNNNNNNAISMPKVPQILSKHYKNPILIHANIYANIPNTNIVGGNCTDAKQQATLNFKKILLYFNHTPMEKIGFQLKNSNKIYLNVKNLQKFGVDVNDLHIKNAILVNKPNSFYELYKTQIISLIIIFTIILLFLAILAKKNRDLHHYSEEIKILNQNLEKKINKAIEENRQQEQILFQQSKLAAMGEMIGAIAHQWRQPLNSLALNIQLLVDDFLDNKVDEKYILNFEEKNLQTINFMSKTIDDFRNFFAKDKEKIAFYLKDSIQEVIKIIEKQLQDYSISITISGDNTKIIGYKNEFKQVILNLINNAKDAIIDNKIKNGKIDIYISNNTISITDNGGGIPENIKDRIFEPYFSTKEEGKGTGIGLYMSKTIIEEHFGGKLSFENINNGTKFKIQFKGNE